MEWNLGLEFYSVGVTIVALWLGWQWQKALSSPSPPLTVPLGSDAVGILERLLPLLIQYKTLSRSIEVYPETPARQLISLFRILDGCTEYWKLEPIGTPWESVTFDPQLHQPDASDIQRGETVYVRFVGYRSGEKIYAPAKVSRTLPQLGKSV